MAPLINRYCLNDVIIIACITYPCCGIINTVISHFIFEVVSSTELFMVPILLRTITPVYFTHIFI